MSTKLRDLIRQVRNCKTAADERAIIAKESANIRTTFKERENPHRHRNVAKLLYIHMLGYPSAWGQIECMRLVASSSFPEKRIGYLGLMILLDEKQKILMMVTNSIKQDLTNSNPYIIGLALTSLGNICNSDMANDLNNEVLKFYKHSNAYLRKKSILTSKRILRKVPDLIEDYQDHILPLLNDKNHAVLLCTISLILVVVELKPQLLKKQYQKLPQQLLKLLNNLITAGYIAEYDVAGITDPYLQCKLLELLRFIINKNVDLFKQGTTIYESISEILNKISITTEIGSKNAANAILYECVLCIMNLDSDQQTRTLGINILGRFLTSRDNNIKYVALNSLNVCIKKDITAIQRHRNTIVDCLKDSDISIRKRALDLIYHLVTKNNVKALIKELLTYLTITQSNDLEFKIELCDKITQIVHKFYPTKSWYVDTILQVLTICGNQSKDYVLSQFITLVNKSDENIQLLASYLAYQMCLSNLKKTNQDSETNQITMAASNANRDVSEIQQSKKLHILQIPLVSVTLWCIGEYCDLLFDQDNFNTLKQLPFGNSIHLDSHITERNIVDLLSSLIVHPESQQITKQYVLNAAIKLSRQCQQNDEINNKLDQLINRFKSNMSHELQQRSVEYNQILNHRDLNQLRNGIVAKMPVFEKQKVPKNKQLLSPTSSPNDVKSETDDGEESDASEHSETQEGTDEQATEEEEDEETKKQKSQLPKTELRKRNKMQSKQQEPSELDMFGDVPEVPKESVVTRQTTITKKQDVDLLDLFGITSSESGATTPKTTNNSKPNQSSSLDLFGGSTNTSSGNSDFILSGAAPAPSQATTANDFFSNSSAASSTTTSSNNSNNKATEYSTQQVFDSKGLIIHFDYKRDPTDVQVLNVTATFSNNTNDDFTNFNFQVAVLKYVKLTIHPATSMTIPSKSNKTVSQRISLANSQHGVKKLAIKVKIDWSQKGQQINEQATISSFPE